MLKSFILEFKLIIPGLLYDILFWIWTFFKVLVADFPGYNNWVSLLFSSNAWHVTEIGISVMCQA